MAQHLDEPTRQVSAYLRRAAEVGRKRADLEYPKMSAACTLHHDEQVFQRFKLAILGNLPPAEIAARLGV